MLYADPITSAGVKSASVAWNSATCVGDDSARRTPSGLRSQTPISHTASMPGSVTRSHSSSGTSASVIDRPACTVRSWSQATALIS